MRAFANSSILMVAAAAVLPSLTVSVIHSEPAAVGGGVSNSAPQEVATKPTPAAINFRTDWQAAKAEAKKADKLLWVHFVGDNCPPCVRMEKLFTSEKVVEASRSFVPVKINASKYADFASQYGVRMMPTDTFLAPSGAWYSVPGALFEPDALVKRLSDALEYRKTAEKRVAR